MPGAPRPRGLGRAAYALIALTGLSAAAAVGMFGLFLAALGAGVARGIPIPNCGCFGDAMHFTPVQALLFDTLMGALSWTAFRGGAGPASLDSWSQRGL